jgi:UDP-glucose 4-epimerase
MAIFITGGAGYIGSHTCVELLNEGYKIVVADDLSNSSKISLDRVREITGKSFPFYTIDICDEDALSLVFEEHNFDSVIHFAGLKAVGESVSRPFNVLQKQPGFDFNTLPGYAEVSCP